jgi:lipid-A-disaccharide synthase
MLVIFPFEEAFYREHGVEAEFVGHPLAELPLPSVSREEFAEANGLDPTKTWIGLLPGSRPKEIRDLLPTILRAAQKLASLQGARLNGMGFSPYIDQSASTRVLQATKNSINSPEASGHDFSRAVNVTKKTWALAPEGQSAVDDSFPQFIIPLAPTLNPEQRDEVRQIVAEHGSGLTLRLVDDARAALLHARASIVASGTATVEAALIGNPFVVVYRVSTLTYAIAKRVVKVPHVAMANLIADKRVVPELIQSDFTAENIVQQITPLLADGPARQFMMEELLRVRGLLAQQTAGGAIERVAEVTLEILGLTAQSERSVLKRER